MKKKGKLYYVFFNMGSRHEGKYALVNAANTEKARLEALEKFGNQNVATLTSNEEYALNKIRLFKYTEVQE